MTTSTKCANLPRVSRSRCETGRVDELRQECIEVERHLSRRGRSGYGQQQQRYSHGVKPMVHEVEMPPHPGEDPTEELEEAFVRARPPPQCFNCRQPGHLWRDCRSRVRNIFCYKCGKADTLSPECENCPGNSQVNAVKAGQTRSETMAARKQEWNAGQGK